MTRPQIPGSTVTANAQGGVSEAPSFGTGTYLQGNPGVAGPSPWASPLAWTSGTVGVVGPPATVVTRSGSVYVCIEPANAGVDPATDGGVHWLLVLSVAGALPLTGGTMSGAIAMGANKVTGLTNGTASSDAAAYGQVQAAIAASRPLVDSVNTVATGGAAQTIPAPSTDTASLITLTANCALTFPAAAAGASFSLGLVQGAGPFTVTWPTVRWPGGSAPALTSVSGAIDLFSFRCWDGTHWLGVQTGAGMH